MIDFNECVKMYDYYMTKAESIVWLDEEQNYAEYRQCLWLADNYKRWIETLS